MANRLEREAERLKKKYPREHHPTIERNLKSVSEQMTGSVDISEGLIAMTKDLPSVTARPKKRRGGGGGSQRNDRRR